MRWNNAFKSCKPLWDDEVWGLVAWLVYYFTLPPVWPRLLIVFRSRVRSLSQRYFGLILHRKMQKQQQNESQRRESGNNVKVRLLTQCGHAWVSAEVYLDRSEFRFSFCVLGYFSSIFWYKRAVWTCVFGVFP